MSTSPLQLSHSALCAFTQIPNTMSLKKQIPPPHSVSSGQSLAVPAHCVHPRRCSPLSSDWVWRSHSSPDPPFLFQMCSGQFCTGECLDTYRKIIMAMDVVEMKRCQTWLLATPNTFPVPFSMCQRDQPMLDRKLIFRELAVWQLMISWSWNFAWASE